MNRPSRRSAKDRTRKFLAIFYGTHIAFLYLAKFLMPMAFIAEMAARARAPRARRAGVRTVH